MEAGEEDHPWLRSTKNRMNPSLFSLFSLFAHRHYFPKSTEVQIPERSSGCDQLSLLDRRAGQSQSPRDLLGHRFQPYTKTGSIIEGKGQIIEKYISGSESRSSSSALSPPSAFHRSCRSISSVKYDVFLAIRTNLCFNNSRAVGRFSHGKRC